MTRRLLLPLVLACGIGACSAPAAVATPITPAATPLWLDGDTTDLPAGCPTPEAINGEQVLSVLRATKPKDRAELVIALTILDGAIGRPTVLACDPALLANRTFPGGITGESALTMTDRVFWGERTLVGSATEGANGLRPGDRLTLPTLGPSATVDLTVAAGAAISSLRLAASADPPASVTVQGTVAKPSVLVRRASGREETLPVSVPPAGRYRLRWTGSGSRRTARLVANPGTLAFAATGDVGRTAIVGASGRAALKVPVSGRRSTAIATAVYDPRTQEAWVRTCKARPGRSVRCGAVKRQVSTLFESLLGPSFLRRSGAAPARARAAQAGATAAATITPVGRAKAGGDDVVLAPGDVNGDGRPDALVRRFGAGESLLVSRPDGAWSSVKLKGEGTVTVDLDGDGRGELLNRDRDVLVTDAFAGAAIPSLVDLAPRRQPRPRDLVLGDDADTISLLPALATASTPDFTGDGRPELVSSNGAVGVFPSEAYPYGRQVRLAEVLPTAGLSPSEVARATGPAADEQLQSQELSSTVVGGRIFTIAPRDPKAVDATPRPVDLDEREPATGAVRARRTFTAAGIPSLLDVDARTGDALVRTETGAGCRDQDLLPASLLDAPGGNGSCLARILRIDATGRVAATITARRSSDQVLSAVLAPDGADADTALEVFAATTGGLNPGTLAFADSGTAGTVRLDRLPRVDLGGKRSDDLIGELSVAVLPNGSRWPAVSTVPVTSEREDAPSELLLVAVK